MTQKGLVPILIVLILAFLVGGYLVYQNQPKPSPSPQPSPSPDASPAPNGAGETANWKTYISSEFSLKYPNTLFIDPEKVKEGEYINFFLEGTTPNPTKSMYKLGNEVFRILVYGDEGVFNGLRGAVPTPKNITVDGKSALRFDNQLDILERDKVLHLEFREESKSYMDQVIANIKFNYWQTYQNETITFKFPSEWIQRPILIRGSGFTQEFEDPEAGFHLSFWTTGNYSQVTGKPYASIDEYINMSYQVKTLKIDGQDARQPLPRAGSENTNSVVFFSKDSKFINTLELKTGRSAADIPEADVKEGQKLFDQILSTLKFLP